MSSWTTPVTDWTSSDYYNYGDVNRVEGNTEYVKDLLISAGYSPSLASIVKTWANTSILFYDDLNRIENNIKALKDCSYEPLNWITPVTDWATLDVFDYNDAIRLESNLYELKTMVDNIISAFLKCGTFKAGQGNNGIF
jgi:hypothetical protein